MRASDRPLLHVSVAHAFSCPYMVVATLSLEATGSATLSSARLTLTLLTRCFASCPTRQRSERLTVQVAATSFASTQRSVPLSMAERLVSGVRRAGGALIRARDLMDFSLVKLSVSTLWLMLAVPKGYLPHKMQPSVNLQRHQGKTAVTRG